MRISSYIALWKLLRLRPDWLGNHWYFQGHFSSSLIISANVSGIHIIMKYEYFYTSSSELKHALEVFDFSLTLPLTVHQWSYRGGKISPFLPTSRIEYGFPISFSAVNLTFYSNVRYIVDELLM